MSWLTDPLSAEFFARALVGGALVAVICGVVGTWVVIRGMAFLGEAIGHGMLPGVALATVLGLPLLLGAAASAVAMSAAIGALQRRGRLSYDTSIGLLFVAIALTLAVTIGCHRAFVVAAFDPRIAETLGLRPQRAHVALVGLVTLAVVASFQAVGTLLVVGLLLAPAVAARSWTARIPATMALGAAIGVLAVAIGLLVSWHFATAAGASIAAMAILLAALSSSARTLATRRMRSIHPLPSLTCAPAQVPERTS